MLRSKKLFLVIFLVLFVVQYSSGQNIAGIKRELVGVWNFSGMNDKAGHKVDTIYDQQSPAGYILANGPLRTYKADGTYSNQFTPQNTDKGTWYYNEDKHTIIQHLYYTKPYSAAMKFLIDRGHAEKDNKGEYYEVITESVVELTADKLVIAERDGRVSVYVKSKE